MSGSFQAGDCRGRILPGRHSPSEGKHARGRGGQSYQGNIVFGLLKGGPKNYTFGLNIFKHFPGVFKRSRALRRAPNSTTSTCDRVHAKMVLNWMNNYLYKNSFNLFVKNAQILQKSFEIEGLLSSFPGNKTQKLKNLLIVIFDSKVNSSFAPPYPR